MEVCTVLKKYCTGLQFFFSFPPVSHFPSISYLWVCSDTCKHSSPNHLIYYISYMSMFLYCLHKLHTHPRLPTSLSSLLPHLNPIQFHLTSLVTTSSSIFVGRFRFYSTCLSCLLIGFHTPILNLSHSLHLTIRPYHFNLFNQSKQASLVLRFQSTDFI